MYREILPEEVKVDKTLGYAYFIDKEHPLASKSVGRVYYHRHISSIAKGAWITSNQVVHHKDHDKLNNSPANLDVMSEEEHGALHQAEAGSLGWTSNICPKCGSTYKVYVSQQSKRVHCSEDCARAASIVWGISKDELQVLIWNTSYVNIAKSNPISDVGAKKRAQSLGCLLPPPYFFNRTEEYRKEQRKLNGIPDLPTQQSSKLLA